MMALMRDGRPETDARLIDFGAVRPLPCVTGEFMPPGIVGKLAYMAPEVRSLMGAGVGVECGVWVWSVECGCGVWSVGVECGMWVGGRRRTHPSRLPLLARAHTRRAPMLLCKSPRTACSTHTCKCTRRAQPVVTLGAFFPMQVFDSLPYNGVAADLWSLAVTLFVMLFGGKQ